MTTLSDRIMHHVASLQNYTPIRAASLYHLGKPAHIAPTLTMLTRRGRLLRLARGLYIRPLETRHGTRVPPLEDMIGGIRRETGEIIIEDAAASAHSLGITRLRSQDCFVREIGWFRNSTNPRARRCGQTVLPFADIPPDRPQEGGFIYQQVIGYPAANYW